MNNLFIRVRFDSRKIAKPDVRVNRLNAKKSNQWKKLFWSSIHDEKPICPWSLISMVSSVFQVSKSLIIHILKAFSTITWTLLIMRAHHSSIHVVQHSMENFGSSVEMEINVNSGIRISTQSQIYSK